MCPTDPEDAVFDTHSSSYLRRAGLRLSSSASEDVFYGAFELRCFLEAKQSEYLLAQEIYRKSLPAHWELSRQKKELLSIFNDERIQLVSISNEKNFAQLCFVPIPARLVKMVEHLNRYCHAQTRNLTRQNIAEIRGKIKVAFLLAEVCASGTLSAPVLYRDSSGVPLTKAILSPDITEAGFLDIFFRDGNLPRIGISYVDFERYERL